MSEQLKVPAGDNCTDVSNIDEFYVSRINWLITVGRSDLIDEIADDCERRRTVRHAAGDVGPAACPPLPDARAATPPWACDLGGDNTVSQPVGRHKVAHDASAAVRAPHAVHDAPRSQADTGFAGPPPGPVEMGTRLVVARLRHTRRPAYRHRPAS